MDLFVEVLLGVLVFEDGDGVDLAASCDLHAGVDRFVIGLGYLAAEAVVEEVNCCQRRLLELLSFGARKGKVRAIHNSDGKMCLF